MSDLLSRRPILGLIGGGFFPALWSVPHESIELVSPYGGNPLDVSRMRLGETTVYSILRHGRGHSRGSGVDYLGNVWALKSVGCDVVVSVGLCGSLSPEYAVGDVVLYEDIIDLRRHTASFFTPEQAVHISVAPMIAPAIRQQLVAFAADAPVRVGGTMVVAEGPRFATLAESRMYRTLGAHLICQTATPECFLIKEQGMQWLGIALVTDTDNQNGDEYVTTELIFDRMKRYEEQFATCIRRLATFLRVQDDSPVPPMHAKVPVHLLTHGG